MATDKTGLHAEEEQAERIVVALDASPNSAAALRAGAELASLLGVELEGLFVEDINLLHLCGLPYQQEVGSYTGSVRRLDDRALQRQLRALAETMRQAMAREARRRPVRWTFQVRRGPVVAELLAASQAASIMSLGRASRRHRKKLGSTAQSVALQSARPILILGEDGELRSPLTVVYTGTETANRALRLAINLQYRDQIGVYVLVWTDEDGEQIDELRNQVDAIVGQAGVQANVSVATGGELRDILGQLAGTLLLPREYAALLSEYDGPTILVP